MTKLTLTLAAVAAAALMGLATNSYADEVTTTTKTQAPDTVVVGTPAPVRPAGVVEEGTGCSTKKVTKTDGDTGDMTKKTATNC